MHIRHPQDKLSVAGNFLYMLKREYTEPDARTLDLLLMLQAGHGGGNNSTFTVRVTSSTGTDAYQLQVQRPAPVRCPNGFER